MATRNNGNQSTTTDIGFEQQIRVALLCDKLKRNPKTIGGESGMKCKWEQVQLQDVVSILGDGLHGTPQYDKNGDYYFINGNNLSNGEIVFKPETKRVNVAEFEKYRKI